MKYSFGSGGSTSQGCSQVQTSVKPAACSRCVVSAGVAKFHGPGQPRSAGWSTASIAAWTLATLP